MRDNTLLITQLQDKDEIALSNLYDIYSSALYGVLIRIVKDQGIAENLLQDTFTAIWEKADQYDSSRGRFYTWAYRIAKNKALNYLRKSKNLIQIEDLSVYDNREDEKTNDSEFIKLDGAIKKLEGHHKRAIELVYFEGLTHREAHKKMNVPLGTFKSYIRQALKQLHESYSKITLFFTFIIDLMR